MDPMEHRFVPIIHFVLYFIFFIFYFVGFHFCNLKLIKLMLKNFWKRVIRWSLRKLSCLCHLHICVIGKIMLIFFDSLGSLFFAFLWTKKRSISTFTGQYFTKRLNSRMILELRRNKIQSIDNMKHCLFFIFRNSKTLVRGYSSFTWKQQIFLKSNFPSLKRIITLFEIEIWITRTLDVVTSLVVHWKVFWNEKIISEKKSKIFYHKYSMRWCITD